jgi:hypothetical protein
VPRGTPAIGAGSSPDRTRTGEAADSGIAGCTALLGAHQAAASNYPKIRVQFARSHWPDLRAAGMAYADLAVQLQTARADGYQTVWFYQRLSLCLRQARPETGQLSSSGVSGHPHVQRPHARSSNSRQTAVVMAGVAPTALAADRGCRWRHQALRSGR